MLLSRVASSSSSSFRAMAMSGTKAPQQLQRLVRSAFPLRLPSGQRSLVTCSFSSFSKSTSISSSGRSCSCCGSSRLFSSSNKNSSSPSSSSSDNNIDDNNSSSSSSSSSQHGNTYLGQAWEQEKLEMRRQWEEDKRKHGTADEFHPSSWVRARSLKLPKQVTKTRRVIVMIFSFSVLGFIHYQLWYKVGHEEHVKLLQEDDPVKQNQLREERVRATVRLRAKDPEFDPTMSPEYQRKVEEDRRRLELIKRQALRKKKEQMQARAKLSESAQVLLAESESESQQQAAA